MVKYENELVMSFLHKKPSDFANMEDNFEMIAKMQHFGLPTRILDFSLNPYIALYFATENNEDNYGKVIIHLNKLDILDSKYTKQIFFSFYLLGLICQCLCQLLVNLNIFLSSVRINCLGYSYIMTPVKIYLCLTVWHSYPLRTESSVLCLLENEIMRDTTADRTEFFSLSLIASISGFPMFTTSILLLFNRLYLLCVFYCYIS